MLLGEIWETHMSPPFDEEIARIIIVRRHLSHEFRFTYSNIDEFDKLESS